MCIMEVRAGQRNSTIAQACAHNVTTVERDCDMFVGLLNGRGEHVRADAVRHAQDTLKRAYAELLELFGEFAHEEEQVHGLHFSADHDHGDDGTNERQIDDNERPHEDLGRIGHTHGDGHVDNEAFIARAHHDAELARRFETR